MASGICPVCKKVIPSESRTCGSCGRQLKISMIPKQNRVPKKEVGSIFVWQTILSMLAVVQIVWWAFLGGTLALILGIGIFVAVCFMEGSINRKWMTLCLEHEYRAEMHRQEYAQREEQKKKHQKSENNTDLGLESEVYPRNIHMENKTTGDKEYVELAKTLEKFKALVDSGAITEDEYSKIKENMLFLKK